MALTGNKGEWSEIYTLLKLLGEGKVYAGDQNLNKIQDLFYPIIMILRQEKDGNYNYRLQDKDVVIQTPAGEELLRIPASVFLVEAENLLKAINENDGAFGVPQIEVFMNSILQNANNLLQYLFSGRFTLQPFVINDSEFRIPCIDSEGHVRPDISFMSDSQLSMISMIISFALLNRASKVYNIIKLDEVDNNLDNENRIQFSILIDHIMSILNFEQCFIISHNNELNLSNIDMILFRIDNLDTYSTLLSSGANIIYDYNQGV